MKLRASFVASLFAASLPVLLGLIFHPGSMDAKAAERLEFSLKFPPVPQARGYQIQFLKTRPGPEDLPGTRVHDFKTNKIETIISSHFRFFRIRAIGRHNVPGIWSAVHPVERFVKRARGAFRRIAATSDRPSARYLVKHRLALSASDPGAGIGKIRYSLNGAPFKNYKAPLRFERDGTYVLRWFGVDAVGNAESMQIMTFHVDRTAPKISAHFARNVVRNRGKLWTAPGNRLYLRARDSVSGVKGIYCRVLGNDGPTPGFKPCPDSISLKKLKAGIRARSFFLEYFAEDRLGNRTKLQRIEVRKRGRQVT